MKRALLSVGEDVKEEVRVDGVVVIVVFVVFVVVVVVVIIVVIVFLV